MQPSLQPPGGGNGVAACMLQTLAAAHDVTLLTWSPPDLAAVDLHYGTRLRACDFDVLTPVPPPLRRLVDALPLPLFLLRASLLQRACRRLAAHFDFPVTAANEFDFGRRGIQYVHYPWSSPLRPAEDVRWLHGAGLLHAYVAACRRVGGTTTAGLARNLTLTNSDWTAARVRRHLDTETVTVHPPMLDEPPLLPWEDRRDGFVCVGRLVPDKEIEKVVAIIAALRGRGHDLQLLLIGAADGPWPYLARIRALARTHADWLALEEDVPRARVLAAIAAHRYGIHGKVEEHFGMGAMEMVRAGSIVFVPDGGGQREISGGDPRLLYADAEDAVEKIDRMLRDAALRAALRAHVDSRRALFAPGVFEEHIRRIAAEFSC